jgi:hypothetical protein
MRRIKLVLGALLVALASFTAFSAPAMAVECDHVDPGVLECGKNDNVFLSEDRFFDEGDIDDGDNGFFHEGDFAAEGFFFPFFVIDDIDCDGIDDDGDGGIDEDVVCEVELEPVDWWG